MIEMGLIANHTPRALKNSLDYRFYDFVNIFEKWGWKLKQFPPIVLALINASTIQR